MEGKKENRWINIYLTLIKVWLCQLENLTMKDPDVERSQKVERPMFSEAARPNPSRGKWDQVQFKLSNTSDRKIPHSQKMGPFSIIFMVGLGSFVLGPIHLLLGLLTTTEGWKNQKHCRTRVGDLKVQCYFCNNEFLWRYGKSYSNHLLEYYFLILISNFLPKKQKQVIGLMQIRSCDLSQKADWKELQLEMEFYVRGTLQITSLDKNDTIRWCENSFVMNGIIWAN